MEPISSIPFIAPATQGGVPTPRSTARPSDDLPTTLLELGKAAFDEWRHSDVADITTRLRSGTDRRCDIAAELLESLIASRFGQIPRAFDHLIGATELEGPDGDGDPGAQLALTCGYVLLNCGRPADAIVELERALKLVTLTSDSARCRFLLAECHARVAGWDAAEEHRQHAIEIARSAGLATLVARWQINHAATLIGMASSLDAAGGQADAIRFAEAALSVIAEAAALLDDPRTPPYVHALLALRHAQALRLAGDRTSARSVLDGLSWIDASPGIDELSAIRCHLEAILALDDDDAHGAIAFCRQGLVVTVSPQLRHFAEPLLQLSIRAAEQLGDHALIMKHQTESTELHAIVSKLDAEQEAIIDERLARLRQARSGPGTHIA